MDESYSTTDKIREAIDAYLDTAEVEAYNLDTQDLAENIVIQLGLDG